MVFDELENIVDSTDVVKMKLGLWVWVKLLNKEGHTTRVVTDYQMVRAGKKSFLSVYSQHRRY